MPVPKGGHTPAGRLAHRLIEAPAVFTLLGVLILVVVWATAFNLGQRERTAADRTAMALAADVANTYEAQMVRALREMDNTLKLIRHALGEGEGSPAAVLEELHSAGLMPHRMLFSVSIADEAGRIVAGTHPGNGASIAGMDYFENARQDDRMIVGRPRLGDGEWRLTFSRSITDSGGAFGGTVAVSVHAGYFVSGYEADVLGEHGVLGLVGRDGIFRAMRTGDSVSAGTIVGFESLVPDDIIGSEPTTRIENSPWDDVPRYTFTRELFEYPVAIVVGLARSEQLAPATDLQRTYLWRAAAVSAVVVLLVAVLGGMGWQLQRARARVVDERIAHARQVEYMAFHDNLTGLPNRAYFSRTLSDEMQRVKRYRRRLALLFLDLDRFKTINDSLGHDAGDELLQEMGRRLRESVRESDIVARLGGDEFVILLPELSEPGQATTVAEKVLATVARPFAIAGQEFRVTVSIGVSLFPGDGEDEQTLMKNADVAMYHAKEQGKNNFQFYSEELNTDSLERLALESSLRNALAQQEFRLYYQTKQDMTTGRVTGMEALLRWQHPDLGLIAPMQFIPLAEETGLIVPIGRWVLYTACRQNVAWQSKGMEHLPVAVNLSARQFLDDNLLRDVAGALNESGMPAELLELEITESMIMHDMPRAIRILADLKALGVRIAIDDFGTGYSSLSKLKDFPVDTIKIDGSFIHDLDRSAESMSLTEAIIDLGRSLSLTVVAEGVETAEQVEFLRTHTCDQFQGFFAAHPLPPDEFTTALRTLPGHSERVEPSNP